jgi:hypothetical protein
MKLSHHAVATAQVGLSYLIFVGYFGIVVGEAMKYLAPGAASGLKDIVMLVAAFWFMRQRTSGSPQETNTP